MMQRIAIRVGIATVLAIGLVGCGDEEDIPTTADVQAQVFTPKCATAGCHAAPIAPGAGHELELTAGQTATEILEQSTQVPKPIVEPGNLANSYLWDKIVGMMIASGTSRMPLTGQLPPEDIDLIRGWIENL